MIVNDTSSYVNLDKSGKILKGILILVFRSQKKSGVNGFRNCACFFQPELINLINQSQLRFIKSTAYFLRS